MTEYLLVMGVAAALTYLMTPLVRMLALRVGAVAEIRARDVHTVPIPRMGGLALLLGICGALFVATRLPSLAALQTGESVRGIVLAATLVCLIGALDDRFNLDPVTKLAGQVLSAGVLVLHGVQLLYLPVPGVGTLVLTPSLSVPLTVIAVVLAINAVNFVDGLDGLAAGVVCIASGSLLVYAYDIASAHGFTRASTAAAVAAAVVGACVGFLPHNFHPAKIFMGDTGSMLLGLCLAAAAIDLTGQLDFNAVTGRQAIPLIVPLIVPAAILAVPIVDLVLAIVRRTRAGLSPFAADKLHLHHRLLQLGHSHRRAVVLMYLWTLLVSGGGVLLCLSPSRHLLSGLVALAVLAVALVTVAPRALEAGHRWYARARGVDPDAAEPPVQGSLYDELPVSDA